MFDIGLSELVVIGVVALVVLGPERLPKVARTAGHLFGRLQRYVATVKADLNREMELSELSKVAQEVQEAGRAFEQSAKQHVQSVETEARNLSVSLEKPAADISLPVGSPTQTQFMAAQEQGFSSQDAVAAPSEATVLPAASPSPLAAATSAISVQQTVLDLGIEPVRVTEKRRA